MNGWTRFAGFAGLTLVLSALAIIALVPAGGRLTRPPAIRDQAAVLGVAGYVLVVGRLAYLASTAPERRARITARLGLMAMTLVAIGGFVGTAILLTTTAYT